MLYACSTASPTRWRRMRFAVTTPLSMARSSSSTAVQRLAWSFSSQIRIGTADRGLHHLRRTDGVDGGVDEVGVQVSDAVDGLRVRNRQLCVVGDQLAHGAELLDDRFRRHGRGFRHSRGSAVGEIGVGGHCVLPSARMAMGGVSALLIPEAAVPGRLGLDGRRSSAQLPHERDGHYTSTFASRLARRGFDFILSDARSPALVNQTPRRS